MLSQVTESALAAIEVAFILKTKVYRSLNMGVLQGGRARPVAVGRDLNPPRLENSKKPLVFKLFRSVAPLGELKIIENHWFY